MALVLPPVPIGEPADSFAWQQWYLALQRFVGTSGSISWDLVDKTGSDLADLAARDHASLQNMQGGTTGERFHLTQAQHTDLTDGNDSSSHFHSTDRARANHTGTQTMSTISDLPTLASGTYTPTLTDVTNLDSSAAFQCQWLRVGGTVTVSGKVDVNPTAAAATELGISLPVASDFAADEDCAGVAANAITQEGGAVLADTTNNRASLQWTATGTANRTLYFTFTYQVI